MELTNYIGQKHLLDSGKPINRIITTQKPCSMILYGNPGIGKTTLAQIIADSLTISAFKLNAATMKINELKEVIKLQKMHGKIIIIMDEIHRLDTVKQNYLLPFLETDTIYLIGTTTENPYFAVNAALRSRLLLFNLEPVSHEELISGLESLNQFEFNNHISDPEIFKQISTLSGGDVRMAKKMLTFLVDYYDTSEITPTLLKETFNNNLAYDAKNGEYYDLLSALQKSIRASDVNAALHYGARALKVGDVKSLWRRLIVTAAEDISLANPEVISRTELAAQSFMRIGMPEGRILLANVIIDLALSPKSNAAYKSFDLAAKDLEELQIASIPKHLLYNQPHKSEYHPDTARLMNNLPKNIQQKQYYYSNEAGRYERALYQNHLQRNKNLKK